METVSAKVRYLNPDWKGRSERPRISTRDQRRANTAFHDVVIEDARPLQARGELGLDRNGFVLLSHPSRVRDFGDAAEVERTYYPEVKALIRDLTGASDVAILQHVIRREDATAFNASYARYVHLDYSEGQAQQFARELMVRAGICKARDTENFDYAWYNTWQPIEHEVQRNPLMLVDTRTLSSDEFVEYCFDETGNDGVASAPIYNSEHRHYYFPRMQTSELIAFKQLDSRSERGGLCAHTSFDDATGSPDALPRRSIEVRLMCVFPRS